MYIPSHDKAAEYRRLAEEARTLARQISISDARQHLFETAKQWELLAEEAERRSQGTGARSSTESDARPLHPGAMGLRRCFFFDTDDGDFRTVDEVGMELSDIAAAKAEARAALADMAKDGLADGDPRDFVVSVRDEAGRTVLRVTLALTTEHPSDPEE
ncbi:DUF6894 family protein [Microvirga zambiensis]|uniref:DUF6894 family protein n=1 Tax=Microvirga zambiensis TaxID=1402137 RepID=UPI001FE8F374|nr:hypothetical protein [Microvirga zambiensis]